MPPKFRAEAVRLALSMRAREFRGGTSLGMNGESRCYGVKQADINGRQRKDGPTTGQRMELVRRAARTGRLRLPRATRPATFLHDLGSGY